MSKPIRVCAEIYGLAQDEHGNKDYAGIEVKLGENDEEINYETLTKCIDKEKILKMLCLDKFHNPEDVKFITPEEYDRKYGEE